MFGEERVGFGKTTLFDLLAVASDKEGYEEEGEEEGEETAYCASGYGSDGWL